jgi:hypothetical protein
MFTRTLKKTSFTVDTEQYKLFKDVAKANNSDASKEIRKFMEDYIKNNKQLVMKINMERSKNGKY